MKIDIHIYVNYPVPTYGYFSMHYDCYASVYANDFMCLWEHFNPYFPNNTYFKLY